ncbi:MAG TPA: FAD-dependent oxidoreductase [Verrucomicrobiae bacterium]|nr:FAD-dependent oxidoreductase [Verrucomicrobiae bacterium]
MTSLTLKDKQVLSGDICLFTFHKPHGFQWIAGQHVVVFLDHPNPDDKGITRALSMVTASQEKDIQFITHASEVGSTFKRALRSLPVGGTVQVTPAQGHFTYHDSPNPALFVAGGVGIGAIRSLLADLDLSGKPIKGRLQYYVTDGPIPFKEYLEELGQRHAGLSVQYVEMQSLHEQGGIKEVESQHDVEIYFSAVYSQELISSAGISREIERLRDLAGPVRNEAELLLHASQLLK